MALTFRVDTSLSASISGLSWITIFAGTFPDRRYHRLDASRSDEDMISIEQSCSPALEAVFRWKSLRHRSPHLFRKLKETMPLLLDIYESRDDDDNERLCGSTSDEDDEDDEDDDSEEEDDDSEEEDDDDESDDEDDDSDSEQTEEKEDDIFAEDVIAVLDVLLEFSSWDPYTYVGTSTLGAIVDEIRALRALCVIAHESIYDMRWVLS